MKKLNIFSFCFQKIKNKFIFLIILSAVAIFVNGFFIDFVSADEIELPIYNETDSYSTETISFTIIESDITEDTFWGVDKSPYVVSMPIQVAEGITLTIEEGVVVKFDTIGSIYVEGSLDLNGNDNSPIYFTSLSDDDILGDTNGDGLSTNPDENNWGGLIIDSRSSLDLRGLNILYSRGPLLVFDGNIFISESSLIRVFIFFKQMDN